MKKYLQLLGFLFSHPSWAWSRIWYLPHNPLNSAKWRTKRLDEYQNYDTPLHDATMQACNSSADDVTRVFAEFEEIKIDRTAGGSIIPTEFGATEELAQLVYSIVRLTKPAVIVETGVGPGITSYYLLKALERNGEGALYSIELPMLDAGYEEAVGKFVPEDLKSRWNLIFGSGVYEVKRLRRKYKNIDLFIHDSLHTYLNQRAEYELGMDWLKPGGTLISDDIENDSLLDVHDKKGGRLLTTAQSKPGCLGILIKEG